VLLQKLKTRFAARPPLGLTLEEGSASRFVESAVTAFFDQDLFQSVRLFLRNAKGSFGLFVSSSLDSHRQFVLAARGQTISLAFYPHQGLVLWGSEQVRCGRRRRRFAGRRPAVSSPGRSRPARAQPGLHRARTALCIRSLAEAGSFVRAAEARFLSARCGY
jgi:hypothetical protein